MMVDTQVIPAGAGAVGPAPAGRRRRPLPARLRRPERDRRSARGRRVILLLALTCIVNGFDLAFTLLARGHELFVEGNPLARGLLGSPAALIAFKTIPLTFAAAIIVKARTRLVTEVLTWCVCAVHTFLACHWWRFYDLIG
jgi:hypothetical protein